MSFLVNFRSAEGKPGYHPAESLEEAIRFVEHLRNQEHVLDARVWRLQEVPLEVKTYYKVEVAPVEKPVAPKPVPAADEEVAKSTEPVMAGAVTEPAGPGAPGAGAAGGPNGARFGRFNRT